MSKKLVLVTVFCLLYIAEGSLARNGMGAEVNQVVKESTKVCNAGGGFAYVGPCMTAFPMRWNYQSWGITLLR